MLDFLKRLFSEDFMPHGHCYQWLPEVLWLNVASDLFIGLAYFSIPVALWVFASRRPDFEFRAVLLLFAAFILACGSTHLIDVYTTWHGTYRIEGVVKAITAAISVTTAIVLWPLIPKALAVPSPTQLAEANEELRTQMEQRQTIERQLRDLNAELEDRVEQRTLELRRSNEDLEQFAYVASHDLQEPLRMVSSYTGLLERRLEGGLDEETERYFGYVTEGASRMRQLIDDLLAFSRAGSDGRTEMVPLDDAVDRALANLKGALEETEAVIERVELPELEGDPTAFTQIFQNLIGNALKYRRPETPPRIRISAERDLEDWILSIEDNGIGIPEEHRDRVFEVFTRLHARDRYPGSGMGLALCKRLVQRRGGEIRVEPSPEDGSVFVIRLPSKLPR
jgi:signal transduction histidine kinase